jgi:hypothetical protein
MCDRRELDKLREQRDDAIGRAVEARRIVRLWIATENENRELRAALSEALDELAATRALLAELTGQ